MSAILLTLGLFLVWSMFGLAALAAVGADLKDLRMALTAPIVGTAVVAIPLFTLSNLGVSMRTGAPPVFIVLLVASLAVLAWRRPRVTVAVAPVVALCLLSLGLLGRPMFHFGFDWIANANGDMAFYVLAATHLMGHGLRSPVNLAALADNHGFASSAQALDAIGIRPGVQITLAGLSAVTRRPPVTLYMPMALSMTMAGICATGALAMQASRKWWAATVAAALLVVSPLAGYGVLQQLIPQNWGLGLAAGLFAWLMRPEMYQSRRPPLPDLFAVTVLAVGTFVVASEVAISLMPGYVLYLALLLARRRVSLRAVAFLWGVPIAVVAVVNNTFLPRVVSYLGTIFNVVQSRTGFHQGTQFGYAIVPTAIPAALGIRSLFLPPTPHDTVFSLLPAAVLVIGIVVVCLVTTWRGAAAGAILAGNLVLGLYLYRSGNDFGLFKLFMYVQPFLAATLAVFLSGLTSRRAFGLVSAVVAIAVVAQIPVLNRYVDNSRNPIDLRNASAADLLPNFRRLVHTASSPIVPINDNYALTTLLGASAGTHRLYFVSRNVFGAPWKEQHVAVSGVDGVQHIKFPENVAASRILSTGHCVLSFPTGSQLALNRRALPEGSTDLLTLPCDKAKNDLVFIVSSLGEPATLPEQSQKVSFWQLEKDPSFPGHTFSGFGRYALFQILGPTPGVRAVLDFTTSPTQANAKSRTLPPAAMTGAGRAPFPVVGSGSARVISSPLQPALVDGREYVLLDMGRGGEYQPVRRPGLSGLWGKSVRLDPRKLTSYVRDVSLISAADYRGLQAPNAIRSVPADLANPKLEYSGIFEDGWLSAHSYAVLSSGDSRTLVVRANALPIAGQHLDVIVDGKPVLSTAVKGGPLDLRIPLPRSAARRRIELRWASAPTLSAQDARHAAAVLTFLGFTKTH